MKEKTKKQKKFQKLNLDDEEITLSNFDEWIKYYDKAHSSIRSKIMKEFICPLTVAAVIIICALVGNTLLNNPITIIENTLPDLFRMVTGVSATLLAILTAFLTFWFGSAITRMQKGKQDMRLSISKLETMKQDIEPYSGGPKDNLPDELKEKVKEVAEKTSKFTEAIKIVVGRFSRAGTGTYYDGVELTKLDALISHTGGEWFVSMRRAFESWQIHDFSIKKWIETMGLTREIRNANDEIMNANNQLKQVVEFVPSLITIMCVFVIGIVYLMLLSTNIFASNVLAQAAIAILLVVMLAAAALSMYRQVWVLISSKYASLVARRTWDIKESTKIEKRYTPDYMAALEQQVKATTKILSEMDK